MKTFIVPTCLTLICASALLAQEPPPASTPTPHSLADAQDKVNRGHLEDALADLQTLAAQSPEPAGVERLRGKALYLKNDFGDAEQAFAAAVKEDPADRESSQMRGVALFRLGKYDEAIPLLEHAHGTIPGTNVDGAYVLGLCYMEVHRYDEARHAFATLYGFPPDSSAAYLLASRMFLRWENTGAAAQMARKALVLAPHTAEAHMILGQLALAAQNLDEARLQFKEEIALNPVSGPAYEHLGDVLIKKQLYPEAQETLNRAVLLEPYSTGPFILLGEALIKQNESGLAVSYLQHAEEMDSSNILTHLALTQAYRAIGNRDAAAREAKAAETLQQAKQK